MIIGETYDIRSTEILENLGWTPIEKILKKRQRMVTFKALMGQLPSYLTELFSKCENENYHLRSNNTKLFLLRLNTNFLKRNFSYRAAKAWNELPSEISENFQMLPRSSCKRRIENTST